MRPHLCPAESRSFRACGGFSAGLMGSSKPAAGDVTGWGTPADVHTWFDPVRRENTEYRAHHCLLWAEWCPPKFTCCSPHRRTSECDSNWRERVFVEETGLKWVIQVDSYPVWLVSLQKEGIRAQEGRARAQREEHVHTLGEDSRQWGQRLQKNQPFPILSRTVRK